MFHKALWLKEYKQSKFLLWGFMIVSFYLPYEFYRGTQDLKLFIKYNSDHISINNFFFDPYSVTSVLQLFIILILATYMVGWERTNQNMDFSLSLPFSRKNTFLTKWSIGVITIITALTLNILICYCIIHSSILIKVVRDYSLFFDYLTVLVILIALFTFTLLMGYLTGNFGSQLVLSFIIILLPEGLYLLIFDFFDFHLSFQNGGPVQSFSSKIESIMTLITFPMQFSTLNAVIRLHGETRQIIFLIIPACFTVIFLLIGLKLSKKPKTEHNGMILLYPSLQPYLKVSVIVCFFLFGGEVVGDISYSNSGVKSESLVPYYIGGIIFAVIAYFILSKLLNMKLTFKRN